MSPVRGFANIAARSLASLPPALADQVGVRAVAAGYEMLGRARFFHERPPFGITAVESNGVTVQVEEQIADTAPFCTLLHFAKDTADRGPGVLLVAPLSGHFSTLLRETVRTMLRDHDVYLTDWHNARDVPLADGAFGLDGYIEHIIDCLDVIGPGAHLMAVCQPCVPALAAVALMADDRHAASPKSMTLMAGPIDTRVNPTAVNELATSKPIEWFEQHVVTTVPGRYPGAGRRVYPGFLQVIAFVGMNPARHLRSHMQLYRDLVDGDEVSADITKAFYDEYFAVLDMAAEFYLETVRTVFQEHALRRATFTVARTRRRPGRDRGPRCSRSRASSTTSAPSARPPPPTTCAPRSAAQRRHHLQAGVGHYGVFSGRRWEPRSTRSS